MQIKSIFMFCLLCSLLDRISPCPVWAGPRKPPHLTPEQVQHRDEYYNVLDLNERDGEGPARDHSQVRYVPLISENKHQDNKSQDPIDYVYFDGRDVMNVSDDRSKKAVLNLKLEGEENRLIEN